MTLIAMTIDETGVDFYTDTYSYRTDEPVDETIATLSTVTKVDTLPHLRSAVCSYGLNAVVGAVARHGCTLVLAERFDPEATLDLVVAERCTVLPVAPPVFAHWRAIPDLRERLSSVRLVLSGSVLLKDGPDAPPLTARGGEVIGSLEVLSGRSLGLNAEVVAEGTALRLDRDDLYALLGERPELLRQIFSSMFRVDTARLSAF